MLYLGAHIPVKKDIIKSLKYIISINGNTIQIFLGSPFTVKKDSKTKIDEPKQIKQFVIKNKLKLFIHANYMLNFCKEPFPSKKNLWAIENLLYDMIMGEKIGAIGCVIHMGSVQTRDKKHAIQNMINNIKYIIKNTKKIKLILETSSSEGTKLGGNIDELLYIYKKVNSKRVGLCVDTAHIFAAGYKIDTVNGIKKYFNELNKKIGLNHLDLIHLNDSSEKLFSRKDRHVGLTKGYIFKNKNVLKELLTICDKNSIPIILETHDDYKKEIKLLYKLIQKGGNKVIKIFEQLKDFHKSQNNIYEYNAYVKIINQLRKNPNNYNVSGIGKRTKNKIKEIEKTGKLKLLENIKKDPKIIANQKLQLIYGIGPSLSKKLVDKGIMTISDLKKNKHLLNKNQLIGLKYYNKINRNITRKTAENIKKIFDKKNLKTELAGSYAYNKKKLGDIDLIIIKDKRKLSEIIKNTKIIKEILMLGKTKFSGLIKYNNKFMLLDIRYIPKSGLKTFRKYFSVGVNKSKNERLKYKKKGLKLSEYKISRR